MASTRKRGKTWSYRVSIQDENGQPKLKEKGGFKTKREAEMAGKRFEADYESNKNILKGDLPFYDFFMSFFNNKKRPYLSPSSIGAYERDGKHIKEYFKDKKLNAVTNLDYQNFLNWYGKNRTKATIEKAHAHIKASLIYAFNNGYIPTNPAYDVIIPNGKKPNRKKKYLSESEMKKLVDLLTTDIEYEHTCRYVILLGIATGARVGELLALTYEDFDFNNDQIDINKAWDYSYTKDFIPTKNAQSVRKVAFDPTTSKRFKSYTLNRQMIDRQRGVNTKNLVFNNLLDSQPVDLRKINQLLEKFCRLAEIPIISSHGLRHTHGSVLLKNNIPVEYISRRLGHQSTTITQNVYLHVIDELKEQSDRKVIERFGQILDKQA